MQLRMHRANANESAVSAAAYAAGQRDGIGGSCSCVCKGPTQKNQQPYSCICNGPARRHRQQLKLRMQRANANESAVFAVAYAAGQREGIGSSCSCICKGPMRTNRQFL